MPGPQHGSAIGLPAILTLGLLALSLAACGTSSNFANQRLVAPENLEVAKRKTLAMVEFTGDAGGRLSRSLARRLARVRIDGERLLEVTGPVALRAGGDRDTDEVGSEEAVALGRKLGVGSVLRGRATLRRETDFEVPLTTTDCVRHADKKKKKCKETRAGILHCAQFTITLKYNVLALETSGGRRIHDPGVQRLVESRRECVRYAADKAYYGVEILEEKLEEEAAELRRELLDDASKRIHHDIAPYMEVFTVKFLTEPDALAEGPAERFDAAAELIDDARFEAGCAIWRDMVDGGTRDPALTYNLAACAEQDENYAVARQFYALTQRYADKLQAQAGQTKRNYSYADWAKLVAKAQSRVGRLHRSQQALNQLKAEPLP